MKENNHPSLPYEHNLNKICKVEDCEKLGCMITCSTCGQRKRKTLCEGHLLDHKEMNRLYRGKLSVGVSSLRFLNKMIKKQPNSNTP